MCRVARPEGLEPPTRCLEGSRSIQLSYGRTGGRRPQRLRLGALPGECQGRATAPPRPSRRGREVAGAGDGTRTRNNQLGRLMLYQLNYARRAAPRRSESIAPDAAERLAGMEERWSGRPDSNRRPPAPKAGALPDCATARRRRVSTRHAGSGRAQGWLHDGRGPRAGRSAALGSACPQSARSAAPRWLMRVLLGGRELGHGAARARRPAGRAGRSRSRRRPRGQADAALARRPRRSWTVPSGSTQHDHAAEAGRARLVAARPPSASSSLALLSASVARLAGVAAGPDARRAVERVDLEPGVVGESRHPEELERGASP